MEYVTQWLKEKISIRTFFAPNHTFDKNTLLALKKCRSVCKKNEDQNGGIKQSFFLDSNFNKIKFLNGPFSNLILDVIEKKKNKIRLSIGGIKTTINMDSDNLFSPVY